MSYNKEKFSKVMTIRISENMKYDIEDMAFKTRISKQSYIRRALRAQIKKDKKL